MVDSREMVPVLVWMLVMERLSRPAAMAWRDVGREHEGVMQLLARITVVASL